MHTTFLINSQDMPGEPWFEKYGITDVPDDTELCLYGENTDIHNFDSKSNQEVRVSVERSSGNNLYFSLWFPFSCMTRMTYDKEFIFK